MAHKVARSKTYIDNAGKDLVAELKALPKQIDESRRVVRERLDALKDEVRRPLTEWEAEQDRIKAEEAMNALHAEALAMNEEFDRQLAARIESDHEMALLMNDAFDREQAEKKQKPSANALPAKKRLSVRRKRKRSVKRRRNTARNWKHQRAARLRKEQPKSAQSVNALKRSNGQSETELQLSRKQRLTNRLLSKPNAEKLRKKPIASVVRRSSANRPGWQRRSAKLKKKHAAPLMLNIAAE